MPAKLTGSLALPNAGRVAQLGFLQIVDGGAHLEQGRKSADPLVDPIFAERLRTQQTPIGFAENDFHRDRFGARVIARVRIGIEVNLFVIVIAQPFQGFFADARPGDGRAKEANNGGALGAAETRIAPGDHIGGDPALPVGRSGQGDQAPLAGNEIFDFDGIPDGENIGIAGAHLVVDANAAALADRQSGHFRQRGIGAHAEGQDHDVRRIGLRRIGFPPRWRRWRPV